MNGMNKTFYFDKKLIFKIIIFFLIVLIFILPSGMSQFLNGVPFTETNETIFIVVILPILLLLFKNVVYEKFTLYLIIIISLFKIILFFSPTLGIEHSQFKSNDEKTKSYYSFWNQDITALQTNQWRNKKNFPLDWVNFDDNFNIELRKTAEDTNEYEKLLVVHKLNFQYYSNNENETINIKGDGIINLTSNNIEVFKLNENEFELSQLNKGINEISLNIIFKGKEWSLSFLNDNQSIFKNKKAFTNIQEYQYRLFDIFVLSALVYDYICYFFIIFLLASILFNKLKLYGYLYIIIPFLITILNYLLDIPINLILNNYNIYKINNFLALPLILSFFLLIMIYCNYTNKKYFNYVFVDSFKNYFYLFCLPVLFYWLRINFHELENTSFWTGGDDWHTFQEFSRSIVINNEWLRAGEDVFYFRPGVRYIFALLHIMFGDSSFAQKFLDAWSVIGIGLIIYLFLNKSKVKSNLIFIVVTVFFIIFFGEKYRLLLGRGLSEFIGCFSIMLSLYLIYAQKLNYIFYFIFIIFLGIISAWIREEKILVVLSLIFILMTNNQNKKYNLFIGSLIYFKENLLTIFKYSFFIIIGFPVLFEIRNYIVGDGFTISSHPSVLKLNYLAVYNMLFGVEWPEIPRFTWILLLASVLISFISIFNKSLNNLTNVPGIQIIILAVFLPTVGLEMPGYSPRHTIYLLPLSLILLTLIFNKIIIRNYTKN